MACINRNLPGYKELQSYFGDSLANSLIRSNDMNIPTVEDAIEMIKGNKVLQFKKAINYLRTTTSASVTDLLNALNNIVQRKGDVMYVNKGTRLTERPPVGAKSHVEEANVAFLKKINESFGNIFTITRYFDLPQSQIEEAVAFSKEIIEANLVDSLYVPVLQDDPISFFKFVATQSQNKMETGETNTAVDVSQNAIDTFGESIVNFANELFPSEKSIIPVLEAQVANHAENGGSTFLKGSNVGGLPFNSVSIFPERTVIIPGKDITVADLKSFRDKNSDILKDNEDILAVGTWFDSSSDSTYLDIAVVLPNSQLEVAKSLGDLYNQKAIFNLENFEEIGLSGTGEAVEGMVSEADRIASLRGLMEVRSPEDTEKKNMIDAINKASIDKIGKPIFPSVDNPEITVSLAKEVEFLEDKDCKANQCETNAFKFVKKNPDKYFPVGGYFVTQNNFPVEHWWVQEITTGKQFEITPNDRPDVPVDYVKGYIGVVEKTLNDDIVEANKVWDVDFFKGGNVQSNYFNKFIESENSNNQIDQKYGNDDFSKTLAKLAADSKNKKFPNVVQFVEALLPVSYIDKYKALYEMAAQVEISVNVSDTSLPYGALASYGEGSVHISPRNSMTQMTSWDEFVETFNHEVIHGLMNNHWGNEYKIQSKLLPVFKTIQDNFNSASDHVKELISYIADTAKQYSPVKDFDNMVSEDNVPTTPQLEELITYAFTDKEFAKFLDSIPSVDSTEATTGVTTIWQQLKNIIKEFFASFSPKSLLDDITNILDETFDNDGTIDSYAERRRKYGWNRPIDITKGSAERMADGTHHVTIDETKLSEIVEENKKNPTEVEYEKDIPDERFQKENDSEWFWNDEQRKRYTINNIIRLLTKKFNIPFEFDHTMNVAAKFSKGKIYLNPDRMGIDSPFHEIAHPFIEMLKSENTELYNNLIEELKNSEEGKKHIDRVATEYAELSPQEQLDEALVSFIGSIAADNFMSDPNPTPTKSLLQRFWDWVKAKLFNMGLDASRFSNKSSIRDVANMITNPLFSIDLSRTVNLEQREEYYQKKSTQQMQREFDALIDDTIAKLKADVNIIGKTETENKRKFFSAKQVEELVNDRKDINALNSFITSGLFNLKDINERFDEFIKKYEAKTNKTKEDIRQLSLLLNEIEDNITIYGNAGPLLESVFEMFPDEKDNFSDWAYSLKREKRLLNEYQSWGVNVVADWLFPFYGKAIRKAIATNNRNSVVSAEVYANEEKLAADEGITDKNQILERAVKQEIRNTLLIAKQDASGITGYLAGVLNSRDSIASTVGQAIMDELHKALTLGHTIEKRFKTLMKQYRGTSIFNSNQEEKDFYKKFLRKAKVWTYLGLGTDGKPKHEYREHEAFHEEYEWDTFYNTKREDFDKILKSVGGVVPTKADRANYTKYKQARTAWFATNTIKTMVNGKEAYIPSAKYKNVQFAALQSDPLFKEMYDVYKSSNEKLGQQGLKFGIVPQLKNSVINPKGFKPKNALEGIRNWIGEQEQVYFVQSLAGGEKPVIPINYVRLLEEKDLSYNLIDSVSKFATASAKYSSMSMIEPQVQILKNFIGGNNALNIKKRRTIKRSASGIKAMSKIIHDEMYVESSRLNQQLTSFLNDAVYGQSMKKEVVQMWDSKFDIWKTTDKSNNGGPVVTTVHGFENVIQFTNMHDLDYSGFEFGKDRVVGEYTIKMTKKDWNFSVKKTADRLGLLTAIQTMIINPISATVNIIRGKSEVFVESLGGRYLNVKDYVFGDKEYWKALGSGDFFEDLKGGKPSYVSSMLVQYDALQGELIDAQGRTLDRGLANKFFRTRRLFFMQNGGEHYIQTQLMIGMMNHQKVKLNSGETISLYEARKREYNGTLNMETDTNWTDANDREFRETLAEVNTRLNGNYNKTDKAMIQRTWWGSALMMFRKHIYNGLANRYRKGYVNYQTGDFTEGYWRTFAGALTREVGELIRDRKITKFNLNEQEKYAFRKFGGDLLMMTLFIALFKMFDDDDDDNEFNDSMALIFRRLVSESGQYTPIIAPLEIGKMVKNPSAISYTVNNFYEAIKQSIADPTEEYERSGPGYQEGDNKAWKKWQRVIPGWRIVLNTQEPERLLQFYQQNSLGFLKPSAGKENEEDDTN